MNIKNDPKINLLKAIAHFGSKAALSRVLGLNRTTVTDWVNTDKRKYVPPLYAYRLERNYPKVFMKK